MTGSKERVTRCEQRAWRSGERTNGWVERKRRSGERASGWVERRRRSGERANGWIERKSRSKERTSGWVERKRRSKEPTNGWVERKSRSKERTNGLVERKNGWGERMVRFRERAVRFSVPAKRSWVLRQVLGIRKAAVNSRLFQIRICCEAISQASYRALLCCCCPLSCRSRISFCWHRLLFWRALSFPRHSSCRLARRRRGWARPAGGKRP